MPYGMVIILVFSVTSLFENKRPPSNVAVALIVLAALKSGMIVPRNAVPALIVAAPDGTQNNHVLPVFTPLPNVTFTLTAVFNAPLERKMYTPGVLMVRFDPTDIAPMTQ